MQLGKGSYMLGFDREISDKYGLDVKNIAIYRDLYIVDTSKGRKALKRIPFSEDRLMFVHGAKEHLISQGFARVDRYLCTIEGKPCFSFENSLYAMVDYIEGRESGFENERDVHKASKALGLLHKASKGYVPPEGCMVRDELGKLPQYFSKRLEDIRKMKKQAQKSMGQFDRMLLECVDSFFEDGENAICELNASNYGQLIDKTREERLFCHHDYAHRNIIMDGENVHVINFDYCCYELRVYDVANLIRRVMRKCNWDIRKAVGILDKYCSVEPLSRDEFAVLKIILQFPQKFWRVANRFYNTRRSWSERSFITRLLEVTGEMDYHKKFIRNFSQVY